MEDFDLSGSNKLFINISLCPHYKVGIMFKKQEAT